LANKQDLPNAVTANDIAIKLNLFDIKARPWIVQTTVATTGVGLLEGLDWLGRQINTKKY
jgi:ADP-ribosylation factor protein 1